MCNAQVRLTLVVMLLTRFSSSKDFIGFNIAASSIETHDSLVEE
jgi:hypothetical protein